MPEIAPGSEGAAHAMPPDAQSPGVRPQSHSRPRSWLISGIVAVVAFLGGATIWHLATAHHGGPIVLPSALLGVDRDTGPEAAVLEHRFENRVRGASNGLIGSPVVAFYGAPGGPEFSVVVGSPCPEGGCVMGSSGQFVENLRTNGYPNARSFPPGAGAYAMVCYSQTLKTVQFEGCLWITPRIAGEAVFRGGSASSLADAAAKSRQIRAVIGA